MGSMYARLCDAAGKPMQPMHHSMPGHKLAAAYGGYHTKGRGSCCCMMAMRRSIDSLRDTLATTKRTYEARLSQVEAALASKETEVRSRWATPGCGGCCSGNLSYLSPCLHRRCPVPLKQRESQPFLQF